MLLVAGLGILVVATGDAGGVITCVKGLFFNLLANVNMMIIIYCLILWVSIETMDNI